MTSVNVNLYKLLFAAGLLASALPGTLSAPAVTLYDVVNPDVQNLPTDGIMVSFGSDDSIKSVGMANDGKTLYEEEIITTAEIHVGPDFTSTFTSDLPATNIYTVAVGDSGVGLTYGVEVGTVTVTIEKNCDFEGTTRGTCVEVVRDPQEYTATTTYTGTLTPIWTLDDTVPTETQRSGSQVRWRVPELATMFVGLGIVRELLML